MYDRPLKEVLSRMARFILSLNGRVLAEYNLSKERITVGRLPDNDIRIDNEAASGHHALIIDVGKGSFLEDLGSTNGTYVNGSVVKKHTLRDDDEIAIGCHTLRFVAGEGDDSTGEFRRTMIINPRAAAGMSVPAIAPSPRGPAAAAPAAHSAARAQRHEDGVLPQAKLQALSGQFRGREFELVKTLTTLGRKGVQVAAILRRSDGFYIVHLESAREDDYPLLNGTAIGSQAHRLQFNDVVQIAGVTMGFFEN